MLTYAIASTFTSHPIQAGLSFWGEKFGYRTAVHFSPYDQVFQELLDPRSTLHQSGRDARIVYLKLDDWVRNLGSTSDAKLRDVLDSNLEELMGIAPKAAGYSDAPLLLTLTRSSTGSRLHPDQQDNYEMLLKTELAGHNRLHVTTSAEVNERYSVADYFDTQRDQLGHIPFTNLYFSALATSTFRTVLSGKRPPYKVIVLDCDNTLWGGVCGEVAPDQLQLSGPFAYLQSFMLYQKHSGKILCLCSKNVEEDVERVFLERQDMPLRQEDLVTWRINWEPKSQNIRDLARELNLGLDSFIFVDDNPVECAEVRANCPEVTTLTLPKEPDQIGRFLDHTWVFDTLKTTSEDTQRTRLYKENLQRAGLQKRSTSLKEFIDNLDLQIRVTEAVPEELSRISQLTFRTNQFNFTTRRRSEEEIRLMMQSGYTVQVCHVSDRFGDYGLVGVMIHRAEPGRILLDSFLLSCRVLGRGVEQRMLATLGKAAVVQGLDHVEIHFQETEKNRPAQRFLESVIQDAEHSVPRTREGYLFNSSELSELTYRPDSDRGEEGIESGTSDGTPSVRPEGASQIPFGQIYEEIARELYLPSVIHELVHPDVNEDAKRSLGRGLDSGRNGGQDPLEIITGIWKHVLGHEDVGPDTPFFDVGGTSLKAVEVLSKLNERFHQNLSIVSLFEHATIRSLARLVENTEPESDEFARIVQRSASRRNRLRSRGV